MKLNVETFYSHPEWKAIDFILNKLWQQGHTAYLAGGCVRDLILKRTPNDFDIATSAKPQQVEELFEKTLNLGKAFGVIVVCTHEAQIEVTTFREDGPYKNGRHPESIIFSDEKNDAFRRDFTINALFLDLRKNKIIDHVEGVKDILNRTVRAVGDPEERFEEDKLRILRALRLSRQLDFNIEAKTFESVQKNINKIKLVSKERITEELNKIFACENKLKSWSLLTKSLSHQTIFSEFKFIADQKDCVSQILEMNRYEICDLWILIYLCEYIKTRDLKKTLEKLFLFSHSKDLKRIIQASIELSIEIKNQNLKAHILLEKLKNKEALETIKLFFNRDAVNHEKLTSFLKNHEILTKQTGQLPKPNKSAQDLIKEGATHYELSQKLTELYLEQLKAIIKTSKN